MSIYTPNITTHLNARSNIEAAYTAAGLPVPTRVDALSAKLAKEPTLHDVAVEYATRSLNSGADTDELLEEAIAALTRAHVVENFRTTYDTVIEGLALQNIDQFRAQAAKDLTPAFDKVAKQLTAAAKKLHPTTPLDHDAAFEMDTTAELKTAIAALTRLAAFASIHDTYPSENVTPNVARLLPIIHIPETNQERGRWHLGSFLQAKTTGDLTTTRMVRTLTRHADDNLDQTIVDIARGNYEGVTLNLATDTDMTQRRDRITTALVRVTDHTQSDNLVRVF